MFGNSYLLPCRFVFCAHRLSSDFHNILRHLLVLRSISVKDSSVAVLSFGTLAIECRKFATEPAERSGLTVQKAQATRKAGIQLGREHAGEVSRKRCASEYRKLWLQG